MCCVSFMVVYSCARGADSALHRRAAGPLWPWFWNVLSSKTPFQTENSTVPQSIRLIEAIFIGIEWFYNLYYTIDNPGKERLSWKEGRHRGRETSPGCRWEREWNGGSDRCRRSEEFTESLAFPTPGSFLLMDWMWGRRVAREKTWMTPEILAWATGQVLVPVVEVECGKLNMASCVRVHFWAVTGGSGKEW